MTPCQCDLAYITSVSALLARAQAGQAEQAHMCMVKFRKNSDWSAIPYLLSDWSADQTCSLIGQQTKPAI